MAAARTTVPMATRSISTVTNPLKTQIAVTEIVGLVTKTATSRNSAEPSRKDIRMVMPARGDRSTIQETITTITPTTTMTVPAIVIVSAFAIAALEIVTVTVFVSL